MIAEAVSEASIVISLIQLVVIPLLGMMWRSQSKYMSELKSELSSTVRESACIRNHEGLHRELTALLEPMRGVLQDGIRGDIITLRERVAVIETKVIDIADRFSNLETREEQK